MDRPLTVRWFLVLSLVIATSFGWLGYELGRYDGAVRQLHSMQGAR